jgi:hypothetical protein
MDGYERNVGLIGEYQCEYKLRTEIMTVMGGAARLHLLCSGK